jgi:hypothetical protein
MNEMTEATELAAFMRNSRTIVSNINMHAKTGPSMVFQVVTKEVAFAANVYSRNYGTGLDEVFNHSDMLEATRIILDELANGTFPLRV